MKLRRLLASFLLCSALTALAPHAGAASSFVDVTDNSTAVAADVLRLMDVVSGSGGNRFSPNGRLTRAEFCVMAVKIMERGDDVPSYTTRTIFTDVTARHWARGYINLAASITLGTEETAAGRLISGVGNGQFQPDEPITFAQAVTILVRMLGYGDDKVGAVWPASYLNQGAALELTEGMGNVPAGSSVSRAQAAELFVNLLSAKNAGGKKYYETLEGTAYQDVMILAVNVEMDDKTPGAIRTSKGTYLPVHRGVNPAALQSLRGSLILDERQEIAAFVPDGSAGVTITLSGDAHSTYVKSSGGTRYSIPAATPAYTGKDEASAYSAVWMDLHAGAQVTLFTEGGKVVALYYSQGGGTGREAIVAGEQVSAAALQPLTGGAAGYTIRKNGEAIRLSDIQPNDVLTYDELTNTVQVSDLRLNCAYEKAEPNTTTPETITVLGHAFPVLDCALDSIAGFRLGQMVTLLLTADGQVAGMAAASGGSTAAGLAGSGGVTVNLPGGGTIQLSGTVDEKAQNQLVTVSGGEDGKLYASRMSGVSAPGDFDVGAMTLGSRKVTAGVKIYERVNKDAMVSVDPADLEAGVIEREQISFCRLNSSGMVDIIVLENATGDSYQYGRLYIYDLEEPGKHAVPVLKNGGGSIEYNAAAGYIGSYGDFVGVAVGENRIPASIVRLTAVAGAKRTDFFERNDLWYVTVKGRTYQVSAKAEGYVRSNDSWFTQTKDRLAAIRAYSNDMTLYVDPVGGKVRIISVE